MNTDVSYQLIDTPEGLTRASAALGRAATLYLDTEFDSNQRGTRLCLLQVSDGSENYLIDPLRLRDLRELAPAFVRPNVEWVVHAGSQDLPLISEALGTPTIPRLFDTQVAWALLTAESSVSLAYLKYRLLGLRAKKAHQADDWTRRPLPPPLLSYAASDVDDLPALHRALQEKAAPLSRLELIYEASHESLTPLGQSFPDLTLASFRNAWQLDEQSQAVLRFLMAWYNGLPISERREAPEPKVLLSIAGRIPDSLDTLSRLKGVNHAFVQRSGRTLIQGIALAMKEARSGAFVPLEPEPYSTFAEVRLDAWLGLLRAEVASALSVAPDFVLPSRVQRTLREAIEKGGESGLFEALGGFRRHLLEDEIRAFCVKAPPPV